MYSSYRSQCCPIGLEHARSNRLGASALGSVVPGPYGVAPPTEYASAPATLSRSFALPAFHWTQWADWSGTPPIRPRYRCPARVGLGASAIAARARATAIA